VTPPLVEITAVLPSRAPSDAVLACNVERPTPGDALDRTTIEISGWVVGRSCQARAVEVISGRHLLRTIPLTVPRPDVTRLHPDAPDKSGFWALTGTIGLERTFCIDLRAVFEDGSGAPLAAILGRRRALETSLEPRLRPLLLTSLGRTGTTLAISLLSAHPQVVAYRAYPYEIFPAKYWLHMLRILAEPANHTQSMHPETLADDPWRVGHNPFHTAPMTSDPAILEFFGKTYVERVAQLCQTSIDDFYGRVAASQGQPAPKFFVEKFQPGQLAREARTLYPGSKEIFLVRDFRDVVCSVLAFNEKRDDVGFGRDRCSTDEEYVAHLAHGAERLLADWKERSGDSLLVRYEELATRPAETAARILEYLELPRDPEIVEGMVRAALGGAALEGHRTSRSIEDSIGRWRRELSPELRAASRHSLDPVLREFGYEPTDGAPQGRRAKPAAANGAPQRADLVAREPGPDAVRRELGNAMRLLAERDSQLRRTEAVKAALSEELLAMQATRVWRLGGAYWRLRDRLLRRGA